jgi:hypothetical protein
VCQCGVCKGRCLVLGFKWHVGMAHAIMSESWGFRAGVTGGVQKVCMYPRCVVGSHMTHFPELCG